MSAAWHRLTAAAYARNARLSAPTMDPEVSPSWIASVTDSVVPLTSWFEPFSAVFELTPFAKSRSAGDDIASAALLLASGVALGSASVLNKTAVTDATASSDATESDSATLANAATSARSHRRMNLCQDFNKVCPCHQCVLGGSLISAAHDANARRWASARARSSALTSVARRRASITSSPSSARGGGRKRKRCAPAPAGPYLSWTFPPPPPLDAPSSRGMVRRRRGVVFSNLCSSGSLDAAAWPFSLRTFASFLDVSSDVSGRKKPPGARCDRAMRPRSSLATPSTTFAAALTVADVDDAGSVR